MKDKKEGSDNMIKLKNSYFEGLIIAGPNRQPMFSRPFQSLLEKNIFPGEFKPRYWLGRAFDKIIQEMNKYQEIKSKLIREHTKKYEKDGQSPDLIGIKKPPHNRRKTDGVIKKWKKGDPIFLDNGQPDWIDFEAYLKEFNELQGIEIDLGIRPITFDPEKGPDAVGQEMFLLIPLLQEPFDELRAPSRSAMSSRPNGKVAGPGEDNKTIPFKKKDK